MKRDLSVMTSEVRDIARKWLDWRDRTKKMVCPFPGSIDGSCRVCYALFPRKSTGCPCSIFGAEYVTKVVKQALRDSL